MDQVEQAVFKVFLFLVVLGAQLAAFFFDIKEPMPESLFIGKTRRGIPRYPLPGLLDLGMDVAFLTQEPPHLVVGEKLDLLQLFDGQGNFTSEHRRDRSLRPGQAPFRPSSSH